MKAKLEVLERLLHGDEQAAVLDEKQEEALAEMQTEGFEKLQEIINTAEWVRVMLFRDFIKPLRTATRPGIVLTTEKQDSVMSILTNMLGDASCLREMELFRQANSRRCECCGETHRQRGEE